LILYKDEKGRVSVNTRFADEDVWLIELEKEETYKKFLFVFCQAKRHGKARQEIKRQVRRNMDYNDLDWRATSIEL